MIIAWLGSILAFFAGILAGIALGKWRRDLRDKESASPDWE